MNRDFSKDEIFEICTCLDPFYRRVSLKSYKLSKKFFGSLKYRCDKNNLSYPGDDFIQVASVLMYIVPCGEWTYEDLSKFYETLDISIPTDEFIELMKKVHKFIIADRKTFHGLYKEIEKSKDENPIQFILCTIDFASKLKVYLEGSCDGVGCVFADGIDHFLE